MVRHAGDLDRGREGGLAGVPPGGEAALGISIDDGYRARAVALGFDGQMGGRRGFPSPALL
jgi:hypothetical protein